MDLPSATIPSYYCEIQRFMGLKTKLGCQSLVLPGLRWSKSPGRPMSTHTWASGSSAESWTRAEPSLAKQTKVHGHMRWSCLLNTSLCFLLQNPQQVAFLTRDVRGTSYELPVANSLLRLEEMAGRLPPLPAWSQVMCSPHCSLMGHPLGSSSALANLAPGRLDPQEPCYFWVCVRVCGGRMQFFQRGSQGWRDGPTWGGEGDPVHSSFWVKISVPEIILVRYCEMSVLRILRWTVGSMWPPKRIRSIWLRDIRLLTIQPSTTSSRKASLVPPTSFSVGGLLLKPLE